MIRAKSKNLFLVLIFFIYFPALSFVYPEFFDSHLLPISPDDKVNLDYFAKIYAKNNLNNITNSQNNLIPLKIHQIWIGPRPLPEKFKWMNNTWKKHHPDWQYKLWTNDDLKNFKLENQVAFDKAKNWGQKSDILRYEILKRHGGVYVDIDFECLKSLDILNNNYEFYCCLIGQTNVIANGLIGCKPNHPIILDCIKKIKETKEFSTDHNKIMDTTGPGFLTKVFLNFVQNNNADKIIALPSTYFFPFPAHLRFDYWKQVITRENILKEFVKNESFAIHYWATSWQDK